MVPRVWQTAAVESAAARTGRVAVTIEALQAVEALIAGGAAFEEIERYIDTFPLPSVHLSALWLLAWAEATDPIERRRVVTDALVGSTDRLDRPIATAPSPSAHSRGDQPQTVLRRCPGADSGSAGLRRRGAK